MNEPVVTLTVWHIIALSVMWAVYGFVVYQAGGHVGRREGFKRGEYDGRHVTLLEVADGLIVPQRIPDDETFTNCVLVLPGPKAAHTDDVIVTNNVIYDNLA